MKAIHTLSILLAFSLIGWVFVDVQSDTIPSNITFDYTPDPYSIEYKYTDEKIELVTVNLVNGKLEVIKKVSPARCTDPGCLVYHYYEDYVSKDIYSASDGEIVLEQSIRGEIVPERVIVEEEKYNFPVWIGKNNTDWAAAGTVENPTNWADGWKQ